MSHQDPLALLSRADRDQLEQVLMDFEEGWNSGQFAQFAPNVSPDLPENVRAAAMVELMKVDLQRGWSSGQGKLIEAYLAEIADPEALVTPELLVYEYQVRCEAGHEPELSEYQGRFPELFDPFTRLLQSAELSESMARMTNGASSRETHPKQQQGFDQLPVEFGRYRVLQELGAGAMGKVYLAHDTKLDRQVALKTPSFRDPNNATLVTRFEREARAAAKLQHRNICQVFDVGEINGQHFISMAYIEGRCLTDYITAKKLPNKRASTMIIFRLAQALREAHDQNVVHRDLKPGNIMVDQKREPIVMDFGLALQIDDASRMTNEGTLLGSPAYMSPEQIQGKHDQVGPATDIYSLGVIFYELLTGKLPFQGKSIAELAYKITSTDAPRLSEIRSDISPELEAIVDKMIAKEPSDRFASMAEVAQAIRNYLTSPTQAPEGDEENAGRYTIAEPGASAQQTALLTSSEDEAAKAREITPRGTTTQAGGNRGRNHRMWLACGGGAFLLLLLGFVLLTRTPYGTLRIETVGDLEGLQVLIDGQKIALDEAKKAKATDHKLQLKIGDAFLEIDPQTDQFILPIGGKDRLLSVTVKGVRLANDQFTVARNGETILKIELLDEQPTSTLASTSSDKTSAETVNSAKMASSSFASAKPAANDSDAKQTGRFQPITVNAGAAMNKMDVAPNGEFFVATGSDTPGDVTIWDAHTGTEINRFHVFDGDIWSVACCSDSKAILVSSGIALKVIEAKSGDELSTIEFPSLVVFTPFPDRNWVACVYYAEAVENIRTKDDLPPRMMAIWDWEKKVELVHQDVVSTENADASYPAVSPDGKLMSVGLRHSHICYDIHVTDDGVSLSNRTAMEKTSLVRSPLVFSNNGRLAATSRKNGQSLFAVLDINTGKILHELDRERASDQGMGCQMAFAADGRRLVVADMDGGVSVWDAEEGTLIKRMHSHSAGLAKYGPPGVGVTPDNLVISAGGTHDRMIVIDRLPEL